MNYKTLLLLSSFLVLMSCSTKNDKEIIADIFKATANDSTSYHTLRVLSENYPYRLCGTPVSIKAVQYMKEVMEN